MEAVNKDFHPVYVVANRCRYKDRVYITHLLRHAYRENGQVKKSPMATSAICPTTPSRPSVWHCAAKPLVSADTLLRFQRAPIRPSGRRAEHHPSHRPQPHTRRPVSRSFCECPAQSDDATNTTRSFAPSLLQPARTPGHVVSQQRCHRTVSAAFQSVDGID